MIEENKKSQPVSRTTDGGRFDSHGSFAGLAGIAHFAVGVSERTTKVFIDRLCGRGFVDQTTLLVRR